MSKAVHDQQSSDERAQFGLQVGVFELPWRPPPRYSPHDKPSRRQCQRKQVEQQPQPLPGGELYLAEAHPAAMVFDDAAMLPDGRPGFYAPYFARQAVVMEETEDYADNSATVGNATTYTWVHPLSDILSGLLEAGMVLDWLHEHDRVPWRMFRVLSRGADGLWRWPDRPWLPLAFSLRATRLPNSEAR